MTNQTDATEQLSVRLFIRATIRLGALVAVLGAAAAITFGYLGWIHPAFDAFSHFRIHLALGLLALALPLVVLRFYPEALFALLLGTMSILQTTGLPFSGPAGQAQAFGVATPAIYRLLQLNLRYDNAQPQRALSMIGELMPDVITLNEVSSSWVERLKALEATYPYRVICPPPAYVGGSAILSRRPFAEGEEPSCEDRGSMARARLDFGGSKVDVTALHLGWPWPFEQPWQVPRLEPVLATTGDTAIIAGDFNAAPWSWTTRRIAETSGTQILRGIGPTWLSYRLPDSFRSRVGLPIDNLLVRGGIVPTSLRALDNAGSDHLPVLFEFAVLPQEKPALVRQATLDSQGATER